MLKLRWLLIRKIANFAILISVFLSPPVLATESTSSEAGDLFSMSLEDLMNIKISTGSLTSFSAKYSPSAITTIKKSQIELSTARNLATLLEQHVPGMMLMAHSEGNKIGIRGLIAAENYKLLLLVNGKNITNMVYEGAILELDQWDLDDIERVEVIRGPGSVTYGSGAIAGVINIITKSATSDLPSVSTNLAYVPTYGSRGGNIQLAKKWENVSTYFFTSYRTTSGLDDPNYFKLNGSSDRSDDRYVGKNSDDTRGPQPYLADGHDRAQIKAHLDIQYRENFKLWSRYTQSGQTHNFSNFADRENVSGDLIPDANRRQVGLRGFIISPEFHFDLDEFWKVSGSLTYDTQEYIRYDRKQANLSAEYHANIRQYAFSQNRSVGSILFDYNNQENFKLATGYVYNHTEVKAPWGKSDDHIWIHEGVDLISSVDDSVYLSDSSLSARPDAGGAEEIGSGLSFNTHTHLLETSYQFSKSIGLLYSHRIDWPDVSSRMYSPRLALISELNGKDSLRLSAQRSLRMMPLRAQYLIDKNTVSSAEDEQETLDSIELAYTKIVGNKALIDIHLYHNDTHAVGFTGEELEFLGDIKLAGLEIAIQGKLENTDIIFNHSYLRLLDMTMNPELKDGSNRNNISFSDYYYYTTKGIPVLMESYGDSLNNWSNHSTRFLITHKLLAGRLTLHANTQIFWGQEGSEDELRMYQQGYDNFDTSTLSQENIQEFNAQQAIFDREKALLEQEDAYGIDYTLNSSIAYKWHTRYAKTLTATFYIDNILESSKRYYVSTGSNNFYPERLSFMEEERTFGIKVRATF